MKKRILPLLLLVALVCALSIVSVQRTAGVAHAAVAFQSPSELPNPPAEEPCNTQERIINDVTIGFANGSSCFHGSGSIVVNFANVTSVYAGNHFVTFTWQGCDFSHHVSTLKPFTTATAQNSPNGFAGCTSIRILISLAIS